MKRNLAIIAVVAVVVALMLFFGARQARSPYAAGPISGEAKGSAAPDFELKDLQGNTVRLSDYKGKAVLVNFWATYCAPCKVEIPWFVELQKELGPEGLQIVGISMDDELTPQQLAAFSGAMKMNYPVLVGTEKVAESYGGIESLPISFYIGRDGKIVDQVVGLRSHKDVVEKARAALNTPGA